MVNFPAVFIKTWFMLLFFPVPYSLCDESLMFSLNTFPNHTDICISAQSSEAEKLPEI